MMIRSADINDLQTVTELTMILYDDSFEALQDENRKLLLKEEDVIYLAFDGGRAVGFAHCSLHSDYVEGTKGGTVGFLEGIFVAPEYRKSGIAKELVRSCENWAKEKGCAEFASACELSNTDSYKFHLKIGFKEVNRIICFTKDL